MASQDEVVGVQKVSSEIMLSDAGPGLNSGIESLGERVCDQNDDSTEELARGFYEGRSVDGRRDVEEDQRQI